MGLLSQSYLSTLKQNTPLQVVSVVHTTYRCNRSFCINPSAACQHKILAKRKSGQECVHCFSADKKIMQGLLRQSCLTPDRNVHQCLKFADTSNLALQYVVDS